HRLHAEFNALRLDEHLDLADGRLGDASVAKRPAVFGEGDFHAAAAQRLVSYPCLQNTLNDPDDWMLENGAMHLAGFKYLITPTAQNAKMIYQFMIDRF